MQQNAKAFSARLRKSAAVCGKKQSVCPSKVQALDGASPTGFPEP
jgi:hypothetical protein